MECQSSQPCCAAASNYCFSLLATLEHYPDCDRIFPFATTDKKTIGCLRVELWADESVEKKWGTQSPLINRNFASLHPSDLPSCFFSEGAQWMSKEKCLRTTPLGYWTEKNRSAVRGTTSRCYVGVKRLLDFQLENGAKTGWTMMQYYNLRAGQDGLDNLVMEEKMILCKVSQEKGKGPLPEYVKGRVEELLECESNNSTGKCSKSMSEKYGGREQKSRLRSEAWKFFIKVRTSCDEYAICPSCDGMLKAAAKNGTSHLTRHSCYEKDHVKKQQTS